MVVLEFWIVYKLFWKSRQSVTGDFAIDLYTRENVQDYLVDSVM